MYCLIALEYFLSVMLKLDALLCNRSLKPESLCRASSQDGMLETGHAALYAGLFVFSGQGTGSSNTIVAACTYGMETMWMASSVSSAGVVDHCRIVGDASSSSGSEGVCTSPTEVTRTTLITFVCGVSLSVCVSSVNNGLIAGSGWR